ncbi:hypothetical protein ASG29_15395 [Sphingomonas sp. Leaf412]|nr:hypothetical protein ASG29_15395 [Sphingomonas sp. Leaf412]
MRGMRDPALPDRVMIEDTRGGTFRKIRSRVTTDVGFFVMPGSSRHPPCRFSLDRRMCGTVDAGTSPA